MRVLIGVHHFPPHYRGGAEWRAHRTASALLKAGHEASVVCVERTNHASVQTLLVEEDVLDGIKVHRLSFNLAAAPDPLRWEYDNQWVGEYLYNQFLAHRHDVFHLISGYLLTGSALDAAQRVGVSTVVTLTDFWFLCRRVSMLRTDNTVSTLPIDPTRCARCLGEEKRRYRWMGKLVPGVMNQYWRAQHIYRDYFVQRWDFLRGLFGDTDLAIAPSQFLGKVYSDAGMRARRMEFLRQGHSFAHLRAQDLRKPASSSLRIGYLGQIAPLKGVQLLLDAARMLPGQPIEAHVYGDGTFYPEYHDNLKRAADTDSRITMHGVYERNQLTSILRNLDVIVVPSLWYENSPNVILEAFAHDTPVIASDFGGMAELVEDERNGLRFALGNASDLARQLRRLIEDPELLPRLTQGAFDTHPHSIDVEMTRLIALYQSVIGADST